MVATSRALTHLCALALFAPSVSCSDHAPAAPTVRMDFTRAGDFYDAPFPSLDLQSDEGFFDLSRIPNHDAAAVLTTEFDLVSEDVNGAGLSSPIHFRVTDPIDGSSLPATLAASLGADSSVFLIDVTAGSSGFERRIPVYVAYVPDTLTFGTTQVISLVPLQGAPLRARTTYAAVVTTKVRDATGRALVSAPSVRALASGRTPTGLDAADAALYRDALTTIARLGTPHSQIAGLAVFTTADPGFQIRAVRDHALAHAPTLVSPLELTETWPDYCVFESTLAMPVYQSGTPPYTSTGGRWTFEADGTPILQRTESARILVTLPRNVPAPTNGFPTVVLIRTGAGGDRPLVERGAHAVAHGAPIVDGSGPAMNFARAGFAGVSVDGPLGGIRNLTNGDEQFLTFNVTNPIALRDNIRQSAVELAILPKVLETLSIDATGCALPSDVKLDLSHLTIMGHSMGATIAPIVAAHAPEYRAMLLSGAGGSYIENVLYKQEPLAIGPFFSVSVGYGLVDLTRHDVAVGMFQWANDSADPLSFLRGIISEPPSTGPVHVLMMQGIVDHYIMPTIANATSLGLGLELAGPALDATTPEIAQFTPLAELLPLVGSTTTTLPASGNRTVAGSAPITAIVTQHREDGIEDGHEVVFQTDEPKHEYGCFLRTFLATGVPRVPAPGVDAMCP